MHVHRHRNPRVPNAGPQGLVGDVIPGADGARRVRWSAQGKGKRGGARVIYLNMLDDGVMVLLAVYVKSERENMTAKAVKGAKHGHEKS